MQVIFSTRGMTISNSYKDALTRKLSKLEPLLPIIETKAVLSKEKHRRTAALTLVTKLHTFRSEETAGDLAVAVDMAVDALARQVREMKDRVKNRKARAARRPAPAAQPREGAALDVTVRQVALKPMSVEEAAAELAQGSDDFVVFTNASTDAVNVLHRRRDGGLGLVEPVA
ncbi:MAG TPA: ribosome-associated translation inhibitor RaiA [Candidatus Methylomirabilis sp.]|nr:ribosome-associated translation inhibitor RaiA [Candidatus Methylomirabilis sp.]